MHAGFAPNGSVMNLPPKPAFCSIEAGGQAYEHLAIGDPEEGYSVFYMDAAGADHAAYDVFADPPHNIVRTPNEIVYRNDSVELVVGAISNTADQMIEIRQVFTFALDATRVTVRMDVTNTGGQDLTNVLVKRYADIDVDTGGASGWAAYHNHWSKDRDSIHAWNQPSEAPAGKKAHIMNMVAMPSDVPLDQTFIGDFGREQFQTRANLFPILASAARVDGIGVLQWQVGRLRSGESLRLNFYYDAFCVCADLPLTYRHDVTTVRPTDIVGPAGSPARARKQSAKG
jgi:hypothetical protein